ncbi:hypothetical protein HDK90DRAFT_471093 [Phyllosticta capitalensis]|uniref:BTB domain-containing protein n=1 Tax=Phyllosticta capitalensis TaxID=121624 RepID=A0ABR1Y9H3_9PEZI
MTKVLLTKLRFLQTGLHSDLKVRDKSGHEWNVHKVVVARDCKFFENALKGPFKSNDRAAQPNWFQEAVTNVVEVTDDDPLQHNKKSEQNLDLTVILNDFRYPAIKFPERLGRDIGPCCLQLEANIYWCDNETAKIWEYLQALCDFAGTLAVHGTVAVDICFKFYLDRGQTLHNAERSR